MIELHHGDCIEVMRTLPDNSVDSIVTDPPYDLKGKSGKGGFMGKEWDGTGIAFDPETWCEAMRVLKPGGFLLAFGGTRTWHRLAVAVEDAGFEIKDSIAWVFGSGFPKHRASLKPAFEPIVMARKSFKGSLTANEAKHGTGALNIDGCRIGINIDREPDTGSAYYLRRGVPHPSENSDGSGGSGSTFVRPAHDRSLNASGRWPANVVLDAQMAATFQESRFFYVAKAPQKERPIVDGVAHPTIKPLDLMRHLVKLVTPADGTVLDLFAGSGTTVEACALEGFHCIGIERESDYLPLIQARIERQEVA